VTSKEFSVSFLMLILALLLAGCATATMSGYGQGGMQADGRSYEEARDDNRITAEVNRLLVRNRTIDAMEISATTLHGIVTLDGSVPNRAMAERAAQLVAMVSGVKSVINQLKIQQ
jgi:osmotically-inducible protein OsmY